MKHLNEYILNEGAWGYNPDQNDGTLDLRGDILFAICELIYDKCTLKSGHKSYSETDIAWEALGNIEYFFEELTKIESFRLDDEKEYEKYYYWWRLIEKKKSKNIIELYEKLLTKCEKDQKWIENWKDPNKMRESLVNRHKVLDRMKSLFEAKKEHDKEVKKTQKLLKDVEATPELLKGVEATSNIADEQPEIIIPKSV